ncbi:MAG TPA: hypothetical protein VN253_22220 [Kofleriaceae bacterium]|nr:hypothetical protein [Kofleriaceae bacterium]
MLVEAGDDLLRVCVQERWAHQLERPLEVGHLEAGVVVQRIAERHVGPPRHAIEDKALLGVRRAGDRLVLARGDHALARYHARSRGPSAAKLARASRVIDVAATFALDLLICSGLCASVRSCVDLGES